MEEKYNPAHIFRTTWQRFSKRDEYKGSEAHDFQVYIEIMQSKKDMYIIGGYKNDCFLLKYSLRRSSSTITAPKNLFKDKDKLGEVQVVYKKKEIQHYQNYDEFWDDVCGE